MGKGTTMTDNKYNGESTLDIAGKPHKIVFDWNALAKLKSIASDDQIDDIINGRDFTLLAEVLAIGLNKNHPGMTAQKIMDVSPPFALTTIALENALTYAYFGAKGITADDVKKKPKKKKNRI